MKLKNLNVEIRPSSPDRIFEPMVIEYVNPDGSRTRRLISLPLIPITSRYDSIRVRWEDYPIDMIEKHIAECLENT